MKKTDKSVFFRLIHIQTRLFLFLKAKYAFSLIETLVALSIAVVALSMFYMLFSVGAKTSMKGTDLLENIRAANEIFVMIQKDLYISSSISTYKGSVPASMTIATSNVLNPFEPVTLPAGLGEKLVLGGPTATITYSFHSLEKRLDRELKENGLVKETRKLALPRLVSFGAICISKVQSAPGESLFVQGQLWLQIILDSKDSRFKSAPLNLTTFLISGKMSPTFMWNSFKL